MRNLPASQNPTNCGLSGHPSGLSLPLFSEHQGKVSLAYRKFKFI